MEDLIKALEGFNDFHQASILTIHGVLNPYGDTINKLYINYLLLKSSNPLVIKLKDLPEPKILEYFSKTFINEISKFNDVFSLIYGKYGLIVRKSYDKKHHYCKICELDDDLSFSKSHIVYYLKKS